VFLLALVSFYLLLQLFVLIAHLSEDFSYFLQRINFVDFLDIISKVGSNKFGQLRLLLWRVVVILDFSTSCSRSTELVIDTINCQLLLQLPNLFFIAFYLKLGV